MEYETNSDILCHGQESDICKVYQVAKQLAGQLPECQSSSFGDVVSNLAIFFLVIALIIVMFILVDFWKENYRLQHMADLPKGTAMHIVKTFTDDYSDKELESLRLKIEEAEALRKIDNESQQATGTAHNSSGGSPESSTIIHDAAQGGGSEAEACVQSKRDPSMSGGKSAEDNSIKARRESDVESTDHFEMVGAAEEGRALLPGRR